jgi:hypothetical protein
VSFKEETISLILGKISKNNTLIRGLEDEARKFSLDPTKDGAYIARIGYREALQDILEEIRSSNAGRGSSSDF